MLGVHTARVSTEGTWSVYRKLNSRLEMNYGTHKMKI